MINEKVHAVPFGTLHGHLKGVIERYTFYFTRSKQYAEDTAQEVFIKLWMKWPRLSELTTAELEDYIYVMTRNQLINEQRGLKRKKKYLSQHTACAAQCCWHDEVAVNEGFGVYQEAVNKLSLKEKAVYFFYKNGYSRKQIAELVQRSPHTVNNQLRSASQNVKESLKRYFEFNIEMDGRRKLWRAAALN